MNSTQDDGCSLRDQLEAVQKQHGITPKELENQPELPEAFKFCWHDFIQLNSSRQSGMGMNPISYSEIAAYYELVGVDPEPWHVSIVKLFDNLCLRHHSEEDKKKSKKNK